MNSKACTADNVLGRMMATVEIEATDLPLDVLDEMDNGGKASFNESVNGVRGDAYNHVARNGGPDIELESQILEGRPQGFVDTAKSIWAEFKNPSRVIGEDVVEEVNAFIEDLYEEFADNLPAGKAEYNTGIKVILDDVDVSQFDPTQRYIFNQYSRYYRGGGELYGMTESGMWDRGISNLTSNVIKSSPTVIIGNVFEGAIKLPTMYPKTFLPSILELAAEGKLFSEIPEYKGRGIYGVHYAGETLGTWEGLIGLSDRPLKNIAALAAEKAGESATKGVQKIAFVQRFGDLPTIYSYPVGRQGMRFMSYTMNTYKMYAGMWQGLANPATMGQSLYQLTAYHTLAALLGGGTAAIPGMFQTTIEAFFPDSKEWFAENSNMITRLVQPGDFSRVGIGYDVASRQLQRGGKDVKSLGEHVNDGNALGAVMDLADMGLAAMSFTQGPLGDQNIQKIWHISRDVMEGELDLEDVPGEALEKATPWNR